ncbi:hypothetical protein O3Q51_17290 [Cryomorphaceae bacterium 1068]|nr:hypothetical protein [Cryomorphaceae bacterium 1068]
MKTFFRRVKTIIAPLDPYNPSCDGLLSSCEAIIAPLGRLL